MLHQGIALLGAEAEATDAVRRLASDYVAVICRGELAFRAHDLNQLLWIGRAVSEVAPPIFRSSPEEMAAAATLGAGVGVAAAYERVLLSPGEGVPGTASAAARRLLLDNPSEGLRNTALFRLCYYNGARSDAVRAAAVFHQETESL